MKGIQKPLAAH